MAVTELYSTSFFSDANLKAYWRLEGNSNDAKNSYNGTDTNITYGTDYGKFNQGASFNGSTSRVNMASFTRPTAAITVSCWVKTSESENNNVLGGDDSNQGNAQRSFQLVVTGGKARFLIFNAASLNYMVGDTTVSDGIWHHLVGTYDQAEVKIYVDGVLDGDAVVLTGAIRSGTGIGFGHLSDEVANDTTNYVGSLDDVAIFDRCLSDTEILTLYEGSGVEDLNISLDTDIWGIQIGA